MNTIDEIIIKWFNTGFDGVWPSYVGNIIFIIICLLAAVILSGAIGFEREYHGHAAGLRTHILVAVGSALIMIISCYGFSYWDSKLLEEGVTSMRDPARLAAQVVTGIGFLGAGTIIQTGTDIKGLTTATTLWASMAIGLVAGSGNLVIAIVATVIVLVVLTLLHSVERFAAKRNPVIMIAVDPDKPILKNIISISTLYGISVRDLQTQTVIINEKEALRITIRISRSSVNTLHAYLSEVKEQIKPLEIKVTNGTHIVD